MSDDRLSAGTMLPSVRKRRPRSRALSKIMAWLFGICGVLPFILVFGLKSGPFRRIVTREASQAVAKQGIAATFDVAVALWPLSASLADVRVGSRDSKELALSVDRLTVKPRLFALLAGKLRIDEIEVAAPKVHLVIGDGKIQNLGIDLPTSDGSPSGPWDFPFALVSVTNATVDLTYEGQNIRASGVDLDVTTDEGANGTALETMLHVGSARTVTTLSNAARKNVDVWEDGVCELEARVRVEEHHIIARRVVFMGVLDPSPGEGTPPMCPHTEDDPQRVDLALRHFKVDLPTAGKSRPPAYSGFLALRAPLTALARVKKEPTTKGWLRIEGEVSGTDKVDIPEVSEGRIEAHGLQVDRYQFAREFEGVFTVKKGKVDVSSAHVKLAQGDVTLRNVEVEPTVEGIPIRVGLKVDNVNFSALMQDLGVAAHPRVTWDIVHVDAPEIRGTLVPLHLEGNFSGSTKNFALYDRFVEVAGRQRLVGVVEAKVSSRLGVYPDGVQFQNARIEMPHGVISGGFVKLGFDSDIRIDAPHVSADLRDITPLGTVPISGVLEGEAHIDGTFNSPQLRAEAGIADFVLGDMPLGSVTKAKGQFDGRRVALTNVRATRGSSTYEMQTGLLDFGGPSKLRVEGHMISQDLSLRDLFSIFRLDADPRFSELDGRFATTTDLMVTLGGPEDPCDTGRIDVSSRLEGRDVRVFGEHFDDAHAEFDLHWYDRLAGLAGAEFEVRGAALHKQHKPGMAPVGWILASANMRRGGELRATAAMEAVPLALVDFIGRPAQAGGSASGLFSVTGKFDDFKVDGTVDTTPVRYGRANLGSSRVHMTMTQKAKPEKPIGTSRCGAPTYPPFDPAAYAKDTSSNGDFTFDGSLFDGQVDLANVTLSRERSAKLKGGVTFTNFDLSKAFRVRPAAIREGETSDAEAVELGGTLSGKVDIRRLAFDDLAHAALSFTPTELVITRGKQRVAMQPMKDSIDLDSDIVLIPPATFLLTAQNGLKGTIVARGAVNQVTRSPQWNVSIGMEPIDLGFLVGTIPRLSRATGTLSGNMRILGSLAAPDLAGSLLVRDAEFGITGVPGTVSEANIDIALGTGEARVNKASASFGGGTISLGGRVSLREESLFAWDATLGARGVHMTPIDGVRVSFDADIRVRGEPSALEPRARLPRVSGNVRLAALEYSRPTNIIPDLSGFKTSAPRAVVDTYDPALDSVLFGPDFTVTAQQPIHVKNNLADVQFAVTEPLELVGTNQRLGLRGSLAAIPGGRVNAFANDFQVDRAVLRFDDSTRIAPHIDAVATTEYRRYSTTGAQAAAGGGGGVRAGGLWRISLHVYGDDTQDLKVEMSSDPALSREDIVLLLAVGLTRAELDQAAFSSTAATAAFELLGTATGADRAIKKTITVIDDFRFGSGYSPRTGRSEPQLTVGRRISENVRTSLTTGLSEERQLRTVIEWKLSQKVSVQGSYDNLNTLSPSVPNLGADLRFRMEFE